MYIKIQMLLIVLKSAVLEINKYLNKKISVFLYYETM